MGNYIHIVEEKDNTIVYLKAECGTNIHATVVTTKEELYAVIEILGNELPISWGSKNNTSIHPNEDEDKTEVLKKTYNENPLILTFYIDRATISNKDFIDFFVDSVDGYINKKNANIMAFFLPTDGEERVECLNPALLEKPDMDKVNNLVKDIANKFDMEMKSTEVIEKNDFSFLGSGDSNIVKTWDYYGWKKDNVGDSYIQNEWNLTLLSVINMISNKISQNSFNNSPKDIILHDCFKELIQPLEDLLVKSGFTLHYDNSLSTEHIYVYDNSYFKFSSMKLKMVDDDISPLPMGSLSVEEQLNYRNKLWGSIKIDNYEESDRIQSN